MNPRNIPQFTLGFPNEGSVEDGASGSGFFLDEIIPIVNNYFNFTSHQRQQSAQVDFLTHLNVCCNLIPKLFKAIC